MSNVWVMGMVLVLVVLVSGCSGPRGGPTDLQRYSFSRMQMGVESRITLYSPSEPAARAAAVLAFDVINRLEDIFSDYRPKSELSRLSDLAGTGRHATVSPDLADILRASLTISERTAGAFDITVGAATKLWRESRRAGTLPPPATLDAARATVGWQSITIDPAGRVHLARPGTRLDLGAIAKGFAAQRAADLLARAGSPICMVALAGDIVVGDPPPGTPGWRVAVASQATHLILRNAAVSTSGDAEQFVQIDSVRYAHILDPRTGLGSARQRSATVVARAQGGLSAGTRADALSTACFLIGDDPHAFARDFGVAVYVLEADGFVRAADPLGLVVTP